MEPSVEDNKGKKRKETTHREDDDLEEVQPPSLKQFKRTEEDEDFEFLLQLSRESYSDVEEEKKDKKKKRSKSRFNNMTAGPWRGKGSRRQEEEEDEEEDTHDKDEDTDTEQVSSVRPRPVVERDIFDSLGVGDLATVRRLVEYDEDILKERHEETARQPLCYAIEAGFYDCIKYLLKSNPPLEDIDEVGGSILHWAVMHYRQLPKLLGKLLRTYPVNVNAHDHLGRTALMLAEVPKAARTLLSYGADPSIRASDGGESGIESLSSRLPAITTLLNQAPYQSWVLKKARFIAGLRPGEDLRSLSLVSKRLEGKPVSLPTAPADILPVVGQLLGAVEGAKGVAGNIYSVICNGRLYYCCLGDETQRSDGRTTAKAPRTTTVLNPNPVATTTPPIPPDGNSGSSSSTMAVSTSTSSEPASAPVPTDPPGSPTPTLDTGLTSPATTSPDTSPLLRPIMAIHDIGPIPGATTPPLLANSPSRSSAVPDSHLGPFSLEVAPQEEEWLMIDPLPSLEINQAQEDLVTSVAEEVIYRMKNENFQMLMTFLWEAKKAKDGGDG